jgi:hypothetical protein
MEIDPKNLLWLLLFYQLYIELKRSLSLIKLSQQKIASDPPLR